MRLIPDIYVHKIEDIPYDKLKEEGIKALVFDLDNTLATLDEKACPERVEKLINKLNKDFICFIVTNGNGKRAKPYKDKLNIKIISMALKPFTKGLRELEKKYHLKKSEMVIIGDQLMTDILSGKRFGIKTVLVDPLAKKDLKMTYFNRFIENKIIKHYEKKDLFKRWRYYE